jgi:hypothetical protein
MPIREGNNGDPNAASTPAVAMVIGWWRQSFSEIKGRFFRFSNTRVGLDR